MASSELQGGEGEEGEGEGHDPETDDDLRLLPAHELEVMVKRGHAEHALARILKEPTCNSTEKASTMKSPPTKKRRSSCLIRMATLPRAPPRLRLPRRP
jgi:hypothetical protein